MALNYVGPGHTIPLSSLSTGVKAGALYNYGADTNGHGFGYWGVVQDDVIGTSESLTTIDGRPILDEDLTGLSIQGVNVGDGKGDLAVEGVYEFIVASGIANAGGIGVGEPLYASGTNVVAGPDASGEAGDSDTTLVTNYGHVQPQAAYTADGLLGGLSLVGHTWGTPFLDLRNASVTKGAWVVETKLFGRPQAGLV